MAKGFLVDDAKPLVGEIATALSTICYHHQISENVD
jgi:hypothetical protein